MTDNFTSAYSQRLGVLSDSQLQAALDRFDLGELVNARAAPGGLFGQNVLMQTTRGNYVLRGAPHYNGQFEKERFFSRLIHEQTPAQAPWPYQIETSPELFGWSFALMPQLDGVHLSDRAVQEALTREDSIAIASAMGDYLALVHSASFEGAAVYDYSTDALTPMGAAFPDWMIGEVRAWLGRCEEASLETTPDDVAWVRQIVDSGRPALAHAFRPVVVHTDFTEGNVVAVQDGSSWRINGTFDLGEAYIGDGEYDLARSMCAYGVPERGRLQAFTDAYLRRHTPRPGFSDRMALYILLDRLIIWEYGQRNGVWFKPGTSLRAFAEPYLALARGIGH